MPNIHSDSMHIPVNPEIIAKAQPILDAIGLSFSDAFNLMLNQICLKQKIPFELSSMQLTENGYTKEFETDILRAAQEDYAAIKTGTAKVYKNTAEMFRHWDDEDDD
ncbi:MAG: type II toxin-antitoxin system RelB/DinJ family antitoxin [Oscillospiraceae bacterium]|nr:type II toxin-antitoxin system RelB/DinJ family antitoxin [Oscillospiraceae bacterium]